MGLPRTSLSALCFVLFGAAAAGGALAQEDKWLHDLKPVIPPVVPLPPNSQVNPRPGWRDNAALHHCPAARRAAASPGVVANAACPGDTAVDSFALEHFPAEFVSAARSRETGDPDNTHVRNRGNSIHVMAGLVPATSSIRLTIQDVDTRDKRGHDESKIPRIGITRCARTCI